MEKSATARIIIWIFCLILIRHHLEAQDIWTRYVIDNSHSGADGVRISDINQDGLIDIVTGWEESGITKVYLHPGYENVRQQWPHVVVGNTPGVEDAVFADLDQDGSADIIISTEGLSKKVFVSWSPKPEQILVPDAWQCEVLPESDGLHQWMFAISCQVDGANGLDVLVGSKGVNAEIGWFEAPEDARDLKAWRWHSIGSATWIMSMFIRDMDHDGDLDLVVSDRKPGSSNGVRWLEHPGKDSLQGARWTNHFIGGQGREVMFMDMADMDADGLEDVIVTEYTRQQIIIFKRLDRSGDRWNYQEIDIPRSVGRAKAVKIGDINQDGQPDIVHSSNTLGDGQKEGLHWLNADPDSTSSHWKWHRLSGPEGFKFDRIELVDLDGDGDLDVLTCEEDYGENSAGLGVIWYENPGKF